MYPNFLSLCVKILEDVYFVYFFFRLFFSLRLGSRREIKWTVSFEYTYHVKSKSIVKLWQDKHQKTYSRVRHSYMPGKHSYMKVRHILQNKLFLQMALLKTNYAKVAQILPCNTYSQLTTTGQLTGQNA